MTKPLRPTHDNDGELITLETARLHLRLDTEGSPPAHPDDALVTTLITVARESAEAYLGKAIVRQTYTLALDEFPRDAIELGTWPVNAITSITYKDGNNVQQTVASADYFLDNYSQPARAALQPGKSWPATASVANAVVVTFNAGYTTGDSPDPYPMPKAVEQAMLLTIGHLYENREAVTTDKKAELPMGAMYLLTPHRIRMGV